MPILLEELKVMEHREHRGRHRKKRRHRNIPPVADGGSPNDVAVGYDDARRRLEPVEELLEGSLELGADGFDEAGDVVGPAVLGGNDVGDGGEDHVLGPRLRADQAEPLLGHHESDLDVRFPGR